MFSECSRAENGDGVKEELTDKEVLGSEPPAHKTDVDAPEQEPVKADDDAIVQEAAPEEETDPNPSMEEIATEVPPPAVTSEQ